MRTAIEGLMECMRSGRAPGFMKSMMSGLVEAPVKHKTSLVASGLMNCMMPSAPGGFMKCLTSSSTQGLMKYMTSIGILVMSRVGF